MWPSIQDDGGHQSASSLWIVECGVGAVVKWSCGVIERCVNMSVSEQKAILKNLENEVSLPVVCVIKNPMFFFFITDPWRVFFFFEKIDFPLCWWCL